MLRYGVGRVVSSTGVLLPLALASVDVALAGPDSCVISGGLATCSGNQSHGIKSGTDFSGSSIDALNVTGLTTDITNIQSGADGGIDFVVDQFHTQPSISVTFSDPMLIIQSPNNSESRGLNVSATSAVGNTGLNNGRPVEVTVNGSILTFGEAVFASSTGVAGATGTGDGGNGSQGFVGGSVIIDVGPQLPDDVLPANPYLWGSSDNGSVRGKTRAGDGGSGAFGEFTSGGNGAAGMADPPVDYASIGDWSISGSDGSAIWLRAAGGNGGSGGDSDFSSGGRGGAGGQGGDIGYLGVEFEVPANQVLVRSDGPGVVL
jgi:hypothetical protein